MSSILRTDPAAGSTFAGQSPEAIAKQILSQIPQNDKELTKKVKQLAHAINEKPLPPKTLQKVVREISCANHENAAQIGKLFHQLLYCPIDLTFDGASRVYPAMLPYAFMEEIPLINSLAFNSDNLAFPFIEIANNEVRLNLSMFTKEELEPYLQVRVVVLSGSFYIKKYLASMTNSKLLSIESILQKADFLCDDTLVQKLLAEVVSLLHSEFRSGVFWNNETAINLFLGCIEIWHMKEPKTLSQFLKAIGEVSTSMLSDPDRFVYVKPVLAALDEYNINRAVESKIILPISYQVNKSSKTDPTDIGEKLNDLLSIYGPYLKVLDLSNIDYNSIKLFSHLIKDLFKNLTKLKVMGCENLKETDEYLRTVVDYAPYLGELEIKHNKISESTVCALANITNLNTLDITGCRIVDSVTIDNQLCFNNLKRLILFNATISDDALARILSRMNGLTIFENGMFWITWESFNSLAVLPKLETLKIALHDINEECMKPIAPTSEFGQLKILNISYCQNDAYLAGVFSKTPLLQVLELRWSGNQHMKDAFDSLMKLKNLRELRLYLFKEGCSLKGFDSLKGTFEALESLTLWGEKLTNEDIARITSRTPSLKYLTITANNVITEEAIESIALLTCLQEFNVKFQDKFCDTERLAETARQKLLKVKVTHEQPRGGSPLGFIMYF